MGKEMKQKRSAEQNFRILMIVAACLLLVKYIVVDFGIDAEFQIAMSYRMAMGDVMFLEMWEPCQTSAFLCAFFIQIFLWIFDTTTGIVIYLQVIGVLLDAGVAYLLYRTVKKHLQTEKTAFFMTWIYLIVSPKDFPLADYTNMQVWFATVTCITLFLYFQTAKRRFIVFTALGLCGAVLSYPSCLIICFGIAILLLCRKEYKSTALLTGICFLVGALYLCLIFSRVSVAGFVESVNHMLSIETAHSTGIAEKMLLYAKDLGRILLVFFVTYVFVFGIIHAITYKRIQDKGVRVILTDLLFLSVIAVMSLYTVFAWKHYVRYSYSILFLAMILIGIKYVRKLEKAKFNFWLCATIIAGLQLLSTLLLTNLVFVASIPYLLLAVTASLLPLSVALAQLDGKYLRPIGNAFVVLCVGVIVFRNAYIIRPMYGDVSTMLKIHGIVKGGPAIGIISEYMGPYVQNESMKEWDQYVKDGQTIYLIGTGLDTLGYLYKDTVIGAPSVVPTPGYSEAIGEYWEENPDKRPDMIIASCLYGEINGDLTPDTWIMQWIENDFKPAYYVDGKYWRYYFKE